ncbi:MAG: glycoside hydrolase family protein [Candidatus Puniceispirillaceae bacterium]
MATDDPESCGDDAALRALITRHEGRRAFAYHDSRGILTIGVGRNLRDRDLGEDEIDLLLTNDIALARDDCRRLFDSMFTAASWPRQAALVSMAFNLGAPRLAGFQRMRDAISCGDCQLAASVALDSRWAVQTGRRAHHIAGMLRGGETSG